MADTRKDQNYLIIKIGTYKSVILKQFLGFTLTKSSVVALISFHVLFSNTIQTQYNSWKGWSWLKNIWWYVVVCSLGSSPILSTLQSKRTNSTDDRPKGHSCSSALHEFSRTTYI